MKGFADIHLEPGQCKPENDELGAILRAKPELAERAEIQPFFKARPQLSAFLETWVADIGPARRLAHVFPIFGDFAADFIVGNWERGAYCLIELEDGGRDSIFTALKGKSTKEWGRRFDHGLSQIVDWFYALEDLKSTRKFIECFGHGHMKFEGMLIIGRDAALSDADRARLRWHVDKVRVDSNYVHCLTFDGLCEHLLWRIGHYPEAGKLEDKPGK